MIYGVTVDEDGQPYKRVIISRKVAVGLSPIAANKDHPVRLDSMIVCERSKERAMKGVFVEDIPFTKMLIEKNGGGPLTEMDIVLLDNDPEKVLRTQLAWRSQNRANAMLCHGDGKDAVRRWEAFSPAEQQDIGGKHEAKDEIPIEGWCGSHCPHLQARHCKPSADLYFMFPEDPVTGSVATLHTGSWEATRRLAASLAEIRETIEQYGGSLRGLKLKLVARPYRATFKKKNGDEETSTQLAFNLEFRSNDHRKLLPELIDASRQLATSLPATDNLEELTDDEIADEFHPTPEQQAAQEREEASAAQRPPAGRPAALQKVVEKSSEPKKEETRQSTVDGLII